MPTPHHHFIQDDDTLNDACLALSSEAILALDTEFVRESTYYPQFCLLQIASPTRTYCIDPLVTSTSDPLRKLLTNSSITFVVHSARQDLELIWQQVGTLPSRMLDSQIAAGLSGRNEQIGYGALVESILGVRLAKEQTRTDWSQRPLTNEQLHYAADDVSYLIQAYPHLQDEITALGRSTWWEEDSKALLCHSLYETDCLSAWRKVKGLLELDAKSISRGIMIAHWRENVAKSADRPRTWILNDETLLSWCSSASIPSRGHRMRNIPPAQQSHYLAELAEHMNQPHPTELADRLSLISKSKIDPARKSLVKKLGSMTQQIARDLNITPSVLASRKDLEGFIDQPERSRLLSGWRNDILGTTLTSLLNDSV